MKFIIFFIFIVIAGLVPRWNSNLLSRFIPSVFAAEEPETDVLFSKVYCHPNPFSLSQDQATEIFFPLSGEANIKVGIYTPEGELVRLFSIEAAQSLAQQSVIWLGENDRGQKVKFGGYTCKIMATHPERNAPQARTIKIGVLP